MSRTKSSLKIGKVASVALLAVLSTSVVDAASTVLPLSVVNGKAAPKTGSLSTTYNFGTTVHGLTPLITHDFVMQNKTAETIYLDRLLAGCSCSTLRLDGAGPGNTVAPGAKVTVHMALTEKDLPESNLDKVAWLFVKGREKPIVTMHMTGAVRPSLSYSPALIDFRDVSVDKTKTVPLTVTFDTRVYGANPPDLAVDGDIISAKRTGGQVNAAKKLVTRTYQVKLTPAGHLGRFDASVFVPQPYNHGGGSVFVTGNVTGSIVSDPGALAFRTVVRGETVTKQILLKGLTPSALTGLKVGSDTPGLSAKLVSQSTKGAVIDVSISPVTQGALLANVLVSTKSGQSMKVLVSAWVN